MPSVRSPSVAGDLEPLLQTRQDKVSVKDIVNCVEGQGGLAPAVRVLTLPVLLPMPPGVSMVLALPLLMAAPQMMIGRKDLSLPDRLRGWLGGRAQGAGDGAAAAAVAEAVGRRGATAPHRPDRQDRDGPGPGRSAPSWRWCWFCHCRSPMCCSP